ncbi:putative magnesium -like protein [Moniliophthora roreri MCA 2997]|uniref:Magnesium-like protein n=1 Tax=Moniliophthora roreri (strain MCA 2997) TaxID=1381753 RepID=V2YP53_MONRO|nr:putative magnesium -like protein [Moniliophthora roreri MCA 2997]
MPRENSFSDSEGRSLTPDLSDEEDREDVDAPSPISPTYTSNPNRIPSPVEPDRVFGTRQPENSTTAPHKNGNGLTDVLKAASRSKHSLHSNPGVISPHERPLLHPRERFRSAVRKVMAMHRSATMLHMRIGGVGAEPGLDPRRASADLEFGKIRQDCVIEVLDYSSLSHMYGRMTNKEFVNFMADSKANKREPWVKVRWINIGGLSWDIMKAVSLKYDIHPLALEDVFHRREQTRSKADYYPKHLFLRVTCHELGKDEDEFEAEAHTSAAYGSTLTDLPRSSSPLPFTEEEQMALDYSMDDSQYDDYDEKTVFGSAPTSRKSTMRKRTRRQRSKNDLEQNVPHRSSIMSFVRQQRAEKRRRQENEAKVHALKKGERVNVKRSPMFIFLFRDGTVISIHSDPDLTITRPINSRLQQRDTGLRTSADPSLLVQSLLDLVVDKALEVIDQYHDLIKRFESQILLKPEVSTVRNLHILSGDLILHKRTLEPIKTLIYGLRRYDLDRCAALIDPDQAAKKKMMGEDVRIVGYMSHKSKIYLADVFDHMEYILSSVEMFSSIAENLIDYTFNMTSYEMNEVMRRLTLATIVFLPLTLLTGYFGMNFDPMWSVQQNSDLLFWEIAIPVMCVVIPLFLMPDIKRILRYIKNRMVAKKAVKSFKTS